MSKFTKVKKLTPWRKLALVTWPKPGDPTVYAQYDFDATNSLAFMEAYNKKQNAKITITHYVAKLVGLTISKYPAINGIVKWRRIYQRNSVDIFLQVAVEDKTNDQVESLSGAKIETIDKKSLKEIADELSHKANGIRHDRDELFQKSFNLAKILPQWLLKPLLFIHEIAVYVFNLNLPGLGLIPDPFGSAMVTSVGGLGIPPGFAPLVPPSRCPLIICIGKIEDKPHVIDGRVEPRPTLSFTITFDHRFMDGLMASRMYKIFQDAFSHPEKYLELN